MSAHDPTVREARFFLSIAGFYLGLLIVSAAVALATGFVAGFGYAVAGWLV